MRIRSAAVAALTLSILAAPAAAQWDSPTFFSPRAADDLGVYLIFPDPGDLGIVGIWRQTGNIDLGVRAGFVDFGRDTGFLIGAELFGPVNIFPPGTPLRAAWMTGVGATFDGVTYLRIPLGLSLGATLASGSGFTLTPYIHPRVAFDVFSFDVGDDREETETELNVDVDLGADIGLGRSFILRFGATFGESDVVGIGLAWRMPRGVVVR